VPTIDDLCGGVPPVRSDVHAGFANETILKAHLRRVRPASAAARAYQRTLNPPSELAQTDWREPGIEVPVRKSETRAVFGPVTGLPLVRRSGSSCPPCGLDQ
jgi:hypothetical protein